jgi:hypothetical protein
MRYVVVACVLGFIAYATVFARQSENARRSVETWRDFLEVSAFASLALVPFLMWSAIFQGPGVSLRAVVELPFSLRVSRWFAYFLGFSVATFALFAALHVVALRLVAAARTHK